MLGAVEVGDAARRSGGRFGRCRIRVAGSPQRPSTNHCDHDRTMGNDQREPDSGGPIEQPQVEPDVDQNDEQQRTHKRHVACGAP